MDSKIEIDLVMIIIVATVNMGVGMFWYSPKVFGHRWMKLVGLTKHDKPPNMGLVYGLAFISSIILAFVLEIFISNFNNTNWVTGMAVGLWAGVGFVATTHFADHLFTSNRKNELFLINVGYHLVSLALMGLLLGI